MPHSGWRSPLGDTEVTPGGPKSAPNCPARADRRAGNREWALGWAARAGGVTGGGCNLRGVNPIFSFKIQALQLSQGSPGSGENSSALNQSDSQGNSANWLLQGEESEQGAALPPPSPCFPLGLHWDKAEFLKEKRCRVTTLESFRATPGCHLGKEGWIPAICLPGNWLLKQQLQVGKKVEENNRKNLGRKQE